LHWDIKRNQQKVCRDPDQRQHQAQRYECAPVGLVAVSAFELESYRLAECVKCAEGLGAVLRGVCCVDLVSFVLGVGFASGFESLIELERKHLYLNYT